MKEYEEYMRARNRNRKEFRRSGKPVFVVHRHKASHLHFDFRLEADGVLKSWAVPKGPSMNPGDKRLAIMVDDHPLEYAGFEGDIPEGHYGAGGVEIWDSGTWEPDAEHADVAAALKKGSLDFTLNGSKLRGEFILIKMNYADRPDSWMLQKKNDVEAVHEKYAAAAIPSH